jgi:hypothetical protein
MREPANFGRCHYVGMLLSCGLLLLQVGCSGVRAVGSGAWRAITVLRTIRCWKSIFGCSRIWLAAPILRVSHWSLPVEPQIANMCGCGRLLTARTGTQCVMQGADSVLSPVRVCRGRWRLSQRECVECSSGAVVL